LLRKSGVITKLLVAQITYKRKIGVITKLLEAQITYKRKTGVVLPGV
jgi:hypothetical protein